MSGPLNKTEASCSCGSVKLELLGAPILAAACYCRYCQEGARLIEALPNAPKVCGSDGGTAYALYRKDRLRCLEGDHLLKAYKIIAKSATNRMVATCCNSAMFMNFDRGPHWVSVYRDRIHADIPLEMRLNTKDKPADRQLPDDVPSYPAAPPKFIGKLLRAKLDMLLGR